MNAPTSSDESEHDRANRLYWESERSVNDIADEMELSKGMLYQLIEPLAAEVGCPECGAELEYPNRTALDRGLMQCPECGADEISEAEVSELRREAPPARPRTRSHARGSARTADAAADRQAMLGVGLLSAAALLWIAGLGRR